MASSPSVSTASSSTTSTAVASTLATTTSSTVSTSLAPTTTVATSPATAIATLQTMVNSSVQAAFTQLLPQMEARIQAAVQVAGNTLQSTSANLTAAPPATIPGSQTQNPSNSIGSLPSATALANLGLGTIATPSGTRPVPAPKEDSASLPRVVAPGLPAIKGSMVDSILAGRYVDFTDLPPARGRTKARNGIPDGQVVFMQASEYLQARRLIPDFGTWTQCFSLYAAVLMTKYPERAASLLMYQATIAKLSQKFKWPSWVIYDDSFRQEAAETNKVDWSKIDASLHTQCFTAAMALSVEGWCSLCLSVEHLRSSCPMRPPGPPSKRPPWQQAGNSPSFKRFKEGPPICRKFNRNDGRCEYATRCNYRHICTRCLGGHPETRCQIEQRPNGQPDRA